jgi:hypothetical protein
MALNMQTNVELSLLLEANYLQIHLFSLFTNVSWSTRNLSKLLLQKLMGRVRERYWLRDKIHSRYHAKIISNFFFFSRAAGGAKSHKDFHQSL